MENLRQHIETGHSGKLSKIGRKRANAKIYWRAKRGLRKIESSQVDFILHRFGVLSRNRLQTIKFLNSVLRLCLVEIAKDDK